MASEVHSGCIWPLRAHVPNLQPATQFWGASDLVDVIPLNRELDEPVSDQVDTIRYHADPPVARVRPHVSDRAVPSTHAMARTRC
jgi:hypothetical protein